jgi:hypothetical protein
MNATARAAVFSSPHLITGLQDDWPDVSEWVGLFSFDGGHPDNPADATRREAREEMLRIFHTLYGVPSLFARSTKLRVSFDNASGGIRPAVRFCRHGFSWLALLHGEKRWLFAPPSTPRPANPECSSASGGLDEIPPRGVTHACMQRAGQLIVVPTAMWHATCNAGGFAFGFGGEDSCDVGMCYDAEGRQGPFCSVPERAVACSGEHGAALALADEQGRALQRGVVVHAPEQGKIFEEAIKLVRSARVPELSQYLDERRRQLEARVPELRQYLDERKRQQKKKKKRKRQQYLASRRVPPAAQAHDEL